MAEPCRAEQLARRLGGILAASDHAKLKELLQPLLLPCLRLVFSNAAKTQQLINAGRTPDVVGQAASSTSGQPSGHLGSVHRQLLEQEVHHGAAWVMLGVLRLHLVSVPAGPDPAAKHAYKRAHLLDLISRADAELMVSSSRSHSSTDLHVHSHSCACRAGFPFLWPNISALWM
jgi:hypothetical protein